MREEQCGDVHTLSELSAEPSRAQQVFQGAYNPKIILTKYEKDL
jgi:hypothetical protein